MFYGKQGLIIREKIRILKKEKLLNLTYRGKKSKKTFERSS
jgi:hypothetical protein